MFGGRADAVAFNSNCALVGTTGGIFKTTNDGASWSNVSFSFSRNTLDCKQIVSIGNTFYAQDNYDHGSSIYKSTDDGANWMELSFPQWHAQTLGKLSNTVYVVGVDYSTGGRLYSSTDGNNWTPKAVLWTNQWQGGNCDLYSFGSDKLYLFLDGSLYYTTDGNVMSTISANGLDNSKFNGDNDLDGDAAGNLFYISNNNIYKYNFGTDVWNNISSGKIPVDYQIMNLSVTNNALFLSAMTPMIGMKLYRSTDAGATFSEMKSTGLSLNMVERISELSSTGLIGFDLNFGLLFSSDGGATWHTNSNQFIASYCGNLIKSGSNLLFSNENRGVVRTKNQGLDWDNENNGIPIFGNIAYFVEQLFAVKDTLFSLVRPEPFTDQMVLYKSTNGGDSWAEKPIPAPFDGGEEYNFSGKCDSALFVSYYEPSLSSYALIVSFKNGNSWVKPSNQNSQQRIYLKGPKNCLFAFYADDNSWQDFTGVYRANNFGMSFSDLNPNQLFGYEFTIKRVHNDRGNKGEAIMDFDIVKNSALFAVNDRRMGVDIDRLYRYDIEQNQWTEVNALGLPSDYLINCLKNFGDNKWLMATNKGLYRSNNGGVNWYLTHNAESWMNGIKVVQIHLIGNNAFLGTIANGVWVTDLSSGIIEKMADVGAIVYPNPSKDVANIHIPNLDGGKATISLYTLDGKRVLSKMTSHNNYQLNVSQVAKGNYYVVIQTIRNLYRKPIIVK